MNRITFDKPRRSSVLRAGLLSLVAACCTAQAAADDGLIVTPIQEAVLGDRMLEAFLARHPESDDARFHERIDEIGARLAEVSDRPHMFYRFIAIEGEELNAYSIPGGTILVPEAIGKRFSDDDELAFVLAHEMAHPTLRHHVRQEQVRHAVEGTTESAALLRLVGARLGRQEELEADRFGALYMVRADFKFSRAAASLGRLKKDLPRSDEDDTHPSFDDRIEALRQFKKQLRVSIRAFDSGTQLLRTNQLEKAIKRLSLFVQEFPQSVAGRVNLGAAYLAQARSKAGTPSGLAEPIPLVPDVDVRIERGGDVRREIAYAGDQFQAALEVRPDSAAALGGAALVAMRQADFDEAQHLLKQGMELEDGGQELRLYQGNAYYLDRRFADAAAAYERALELRDGDWPEAKMNLALTMERLGHVDRAIALWRELSPDPGLGPTAQSKLTELGAEAGAEASVGR